MEFSKTYGKENSLLGSKIYTVDNFYKDPEEVSDYLFNRESPLWKSEQIPSYNSLYFNDSGLAKISIGLGKGKKKYDKRAVIKSREWGRKKQSLEKNKEI